MIPSENDMIALGAPTIVYDHSFTPFIQRNAPSRHAEQQRQSADVAAGNPMAMLRSDADASGTARGSSSIPDASASAVTGSDQSGREESRASTPSDQNGPEGSYSPVPSSSSQHDDEGLPPSPRRSNVRPRCKGRAEIVEKRKRQHSPCSNRAVQKAQEAEDEEYARRLSEQRVSERQRRKRVRRN